MKAKIKLLSNQDEIDEAERLGLKVTPKPVYVNGTIHFRSKNVFHYYVETYQGEMQIIMYIYPNHVYRIKYSREIDRRLAHIIERDE